jgi:exodeoxyribonuclease V alpha subunit
MTVHKRQGSEFDRVMLVLPDRDSPVLTRELIYTAITRARVAIEIRTDHDVFARSVERRTLRSSGLNDLLWGPRHA